MSCLPTCLYSLLANNIIDDALAGPWDFEDIKQTPGIGASIDGHPNVTCLPVLSSFRASLILIHEVMLRASLDLGHAL